LRAPTGCQNRKTTTDTDVAWQKCDEDTSFREPVKIFFARGCEEVTIRIQKARFGHHDEENNFLKNF
jgi:hypothetical protein